MKCSEKIRSLRKALHLNQQELADLTGVSKRSVAAYETDEAKPRLSTLRKLAAVLKCSEEYLSRDDISDPRFSISEEGRVEAASYYNDASENEAELLLAKNAALFAGGSLSQEAKDAFFEAVMRAYINCKEEARRVNGKKD